MSELITKWYNQVFYDKAISTRQLYENDVCNSCNAEILKINIIWTGQRFGMAGYIICNDCYQQGRYNINNTCDFSDNESKCGDFDLKLGWYRQLNYNQDVCVNHYHKLNPNDYLVFTLINDTWLTRVDLQSDDKYYKGLDSEIYYPIKECQITLPDLISKDTYLKLTRQWLNIDEYNPQPSDPSFWCQLTHSNDIDYGNYSFKNDYGGMFNDEKIGSINHWVPFDTFDEGAITRYGGYALVNACLDSPKYGQVLTCVANCDDEFRFDLCQMSLSEYLKGKQNYEGDPTDLNRMIHNEIICGACGMENIRGYLHICCENLELCHECMLKGSRCSESMDHKLNHIIGEKLNYIEKLRLELGQYVK